MNYDNLLSTLAKEPEWPEQNETVSAECPHRVWRLNIGNCQAILEPYTFTTANPGKEVRGKLIDAFNDWLQVPPEQLTTIAKIVNMLHSASLMYGRLAYGLAVTHSADMAPPGLMISRTTRSFDEATQVRNIQ